MFNTWSFLSYIEILTRKSVNYKYNSNRVLIHNLLVQDDVIFEYDWICLVVLILRIYLEKQIPGGYFSRRYDPIIHESDLESALVDKTKQLARGKGARRRSIQPPPEGGAPIPCGGGPSATCFLRHPSHLSVSFCHHHGPAAKG